MTMDERRHERLISETLVHSSKQGKRRTHLCCNISRLGCMIADDGLSASTGDDLDIELVGGVVVPARVIWARQGHLGLSFKRELNPATVRFLAVEQGHIDDALLRDRFGRVLPNGMGQHAA